MLLCHGVISAGHLRCTDAVQFDWQLQAYAHTCCQQLSWCICCHGQYVSPVALQCLVAGHIIFVLVLPHKHLQKQQNSSHMAGELDTMNEHSRLLASNVLLWCFPAASTGPMLLQLDKQTHCTGTTGAYLGIPARSIHNIAAALIIPCKQHI